MPEVGVVDVVLLVLVAFGELVMLIGTVEVRLGEMRASVWLALNCVDAETVSSSVSDSVAVVESALLFTKACLGNLIALLLTAKSIQLQKYAGAMDVVGSGRESFLVIIVRRAVILSSLESCQ